MRDGDDLARNQVAEELGGTQDVLSVLERDGVEGEVDGRLGVAVHAGSRVDGHAEVGEDLAMEDKVLGGEHDPEEFGLRTGERDGSHSAKQ